jgi:DNA-directed RNA polymerase specialized sigma24 family protein
MTDSRALLVEYADNGTEAAFRELVARYLDLVYSTALRQVGGDAHLAQDVAQTVFLHLARKARSLPQGVMLGGWLHQATSNVAATITRSERRRQARERQAAQMNTLLNDNRSLQQQVQDLRDARERLARAQADQGELEKLRRNQSELLRLRGEVTALRNGLKATARQASQADRVTPDAGTPADTAPGVTRLQASIRAQVDSGQTLLTGGWVSERGKRIFVLATPRIEGDNTDQVSIKTKVIEATEAALSKVGLDTFKAEGAESSVQHVFAADQMDALFKELQGADGVDFLAESDMLTADGRQVQIRAIDQQGGVEQNLGSTIDVVPVISTDKRAIDVTLRAGVNRLTPKPQ